jgi:Gpi18-like mannosyltransferase
MQGSKLVIISIIGLLVFSNLKKKKTIENLQNEMEEIKDQNEKEYKEKMFSKFREYSTVQSEYRKEMSSMIVSIAFFTITFIILIMIGSFIVFSKKTENTENN